MPGRQVPADQRINPGDGSPLHGTGTGYRDHLCSCDKCLAYNYNAQKKVRARRLAEMQADPNDRHHGTETGYHYGCHCSRCNAARRDADRARTQRAADVRARLNTEKANKRKVNS